MLEADIVRAALFPFMLAGTVVIWRKRRHVAGRLMVLIGTLHLAGGWVGRAPLARMAANGLFSQADSAVGHTASKTDQEMIFWFLLWGVVTIMLGQLLILLDRRKIRVPRFVGVELLVVNLACAVLMPKGGFWWVLLPAWLIARDGGQGRPANAH
jgi:hypothetical protein